jgi:hypothetical protein
VFFKYLKSVDKGHSETIGAHLQKEASGVREASRFICFLLPELYAKNTSYLQMYWLSAACNAQGLNCCLHCRTDDWCEVCVTVHHVGSPVLL